MPDGVQAELFDAITRRVIAGYVAQMSTEELLELMGHIIIRSVESRVQRENR